MGYPGYGNTGFNPYGLPPGPFPGQPGAPGNATPAVPPGSQVPEPIPAPKEAPKPLPPGNTAQQYPPMMPFQPVGYYPMYYNPYYYPGYGPYPGMPAYYNQPAPNSAY